MGHDFRPEYRNLRLIINQIDNRIPIIALTATATPKVQDDIIKNLKITDAKVLKVLLIVLTFIMKFEQRLHKLKLRLLKFIKSNNGKSGIVYCLARKSVEELTEALKVNGINALHIMLV